MSVFTLSYQHLFRKIWLRHQKTSGFWRLFPVLSLHPVSLTLTIGSGLLSQLTITAITAVGAYFVGSAIGVSSFVALLPVLWILGSLVIVEAGLEWCESWFSHDLAYRILTDLRTQLYWALERLNPGYILKQRTGDIVTALMADVEMLEWFYAHTVGASLVASLVTLATLFALAWIHWSLAVVLLPSLLLVITVPWWLRQKAALQGKEFRSQLAAINAEVVDNIQGLREIIALNQAPDQLKKLAARGQRLAQVQRAHSERSGLELALTNTFIGLGLLSVLALSVLLSSHKIIPMPLFPVSIILAARIFAPVMSVMNTLRNFNVILAAADRVFALVHRPQIVRDTVSVAPAEAIAPQLEFHEVCFRYEEASPDVLHNLSFAVAAGETVALVGPSGAGKSTCVHLLMRFWDVTSGNITLGGYDLRAFPQADLRERITLVPQDSYLFNTTIRENIRLGKPDATNTEIEKAAHLARIHAFIAQLPHGYETSIGERGVQLSGGQKQRIAIARALLKNAPILIMDEGMSNLDTENEHEVQLAMAQARIGRTTLLIAHRLSTIQSADRIVVINEGCIVESGTHSALLAQHGLYAQLIARQQVQPV